MGIIEEISLAIVNKPKSYRNGQAAFNKLFDLKPEVADRIRGSVLDPFYDDKKLDGFWVLLFAMFDGENV